MSHKIPLAVLPWRLENLENESGHWTWKVEFSFQFWKFTNFVHELCQICMDIATTITKTSNIDVESLHFPTFSTKCRECKMEKRDGHGQLRNGQGKVMEKYFVKSVGTLPRKDYILSLTMF